MTSTQSYVAHDYLGPSAPATLLPVDQTSPATAANRCVVFACDEAYAMPLATALASLTGSRTSGPPLRVFVLTEHFAEPIRQQVLDSLPPQSVILDWVPIDLAAFKQFSTLSYTSKMTYARLLVPHLLPPAITTALYLDCDLLVLSEINDLLELELQGAVLGAVIDPVDAELKAHNPRFQHLPRVENYFNAGVLLIDLERWRKMQISEKAMTYLQDHPLAPFADQDALNAACDGLWTRLDSSWNYQHCSTTDLARLLPESRPAIAHFVMSRKPWNAAVHNINRNFYDSFRNRTRFRRSMSERALDLGRTLWCTTKHQVKRRLPALAARLSSKNKR